MKKIVLVLFSFLWNLSAVFSQLSENFNSGIPWNWIQSQSTAVSYTVAPAAGIGGTGCAVAYTDLSIYNDTRGYLQTHSLNLTSISNPVLSFKLGIIKDNGWFTNPPYFSLWYVLGNGWGYMGDWGDPAYYSSATYTITLSSAAAIASNTLNISWLSVTKSLSAFSAQTNIHFAFGAEYSLGNPYGWIVLDDIVIQSDPAGIENSFNDSSIVIFPNPSTELIHINAKMSISKYVITNPLGQVVLEGQLSGQNIDISALKNDFYFLSLIGSDNKLIHTTTFVKSGL